MTAGGKVQTGCDKKHGIGAYEAGFIYLVVINDEILAQDGEGDFVSHFSDILGTTAKEGGIGEDGQSACSIGGIGRDYVSRTGLLLNPTQRG